MRWDVIIPYLAGFGLTLLRVSGMFLVVPTLGGEAVPLRLRAAAAFLVTLTLASLVGPRPLGEPLELAVAATGELLLGMAMGLVVRLVLSSAEMAGELVAMQIGLSFIQMVDPLTRESSNITSQLVGAMAILVFLALDGHHALIAGLGASLREAPVGTVLPRAVGASTLVPLLSSTVAAAVRIAAPVIVALLLTNGALGLLSRAAPQLQLFVLSFGVTIAVGIFVFSSSIAPALTLLAQELRRLPEYLGAVVGD